MSDQVILKTETKMIIGRVISLLRNKRARIFLKLYEPFVYSLCLCILSITYTCDYFSEEPIITQEEYDRRAFILSLIGGCSLFTIARIISYSSGSGRKLAVTP